MTADPFPDQASRYLLEHDHYTADLGHWRAAARRQGSPVLDLGAAAGRVSLPLARDGAEVWALDADPAMVDEITRRLAGEPPEVRERVHPVLGDMRALDLDRRFALIIMAMNTFQVLLDPDEQLACLNGIRRHLAPGGELVFDLVLPDAAEIASTLGVVRATGVHHDPASGATLFHSAYYEAFDPVTQTLDFTILVDERGAGGGLTRQARHHRVHLYTPPEVGHLVARAGLEVTSAEGGFHGEPLDPGSEQVVYRCRAVEDA